MLSIGALLAGVSLVLFWPVLRNFVLVLQGKDTQTQLSVGETAAPPELAAREANRRGLDLLAAGRFEEAEMALRRAIMAAPGNVEFRLGMASLYRARGNADQAQQVFRDVLATHPTNGPANRGLADLLLALDRPDASLPFYATVLKLGPADAKLHRSYAAALTATGKPNKAIEQLQLALKEEPKDAAANFELAELLSRKGRTREAAGCYTRAVEADPKLAPALTSLAWILAADADDTLRNGRRAVELAERACELSDWDTASYISTLAVAYAEAGRFSEALETAEKAWDRALSKNENDVAKLNEQLMALFKEGKAFRSPSMLRTSPAPEDAKSEVPGQGTGKSPKSPSGI